MLETRKEDLKKAFSFVAYWQACSQTIISTLSDSILPLEDHLACFLDSNSLSTF